MSALRCLLIEASGQGEDGKEGEWLAESGARKEGAGCLPQVIRLFGLGEEPDFKVSLLTASLEKFSAYLCCSSLGWSEG